MKHIIFDLDMTLIDSSIAEDARRKRIWHQVYSLIPNFVVFEGMNEVFSYIRYNNIKVCVVSNAPQNYINKVIGYFNIPCNYVVDYFTVKPVKPHPAQMYKALEMLQEPASNVVAFGDRLIDIQASKAGGIKSVACFWGTKEPILLKASRYDLAIYHPNEIINSL